MDGTTIRLRPHFTSTRPERHPIEAAPPDSGFRAYRLTKFYRDWVARHGIAEPDVTSHILYECDGIIARRWFILTFQTPADAMVFKIRFYDMLDRYSYEGPP